MNISLSVESDYEEHHPTLHTNVINDPSRRDIQSLSYATTLFVRSRKDICK